MHLFSSAKLLWGIFGLSLKIPGYVLYKVCFKHDVLNNCAVLFNGDVVGTAFQI